MDSANFIHKIFIANKIPTALITSPVSSPLTSLSLHRYLAKSLSSGASHVIIEAPATVLEKHVFHNLPIHMAILTNTNTITPDAISSGATDTVAHKSLIFQDLPHFIVLNRDDPRYEHFSTFPAKTATATFGQHKDANVRINRSKLYKKGTEANLIHGASAFDVATFVVGEDAVSYMAAAAAAAALLDIPIDNIIDGIASYEPQTNIIL